jgi:hypothetical protein
MIHDNCILIESPSGKEIRIGKPVSGYINMFFSFNPLIQLGFYDKLNRSSIMSITNISHYAGGTGGMAIKLIDGVKYEDAVSSIREIFESEIK